MMWSRRAVLGACAAAVATRAQDRNMFADAQAYERFMGRWSRLLAARFIDFAGVPDTGHVLDVGCGTGVLTFEIARRRSRLRVMGVDISKEYIAYANQQNRDERIHFETADAQRTAFPDEGFEGCVSLLVLNFIPQPQRAVAEMRRVTKPRGRIAAAVWDYGEGMQMLRVFWDAAVALDPAAERVDEKHMPLCRSGELRDLWNRGGLQHVNERPLDVEMRFESFEDYWEPFLLGQGPAGVYVKSLSAEKVTALKDRVRRRLSMDSSGPGFRLGARAWAVRGDRPA